MPSEAEEKDLLESERHKAVANLQMYQDETRSWRDSKVKKKILILATSSFCGALAQRAPASSSQKGRGHRRSSK
jgi:hypothetical protein